MPRLRVRSPVGTYKEAANESVSEWSNESEVFSLWSVEVLLQMLLYSRRPSPFPLGRTVVEKDSLRKSPVEPGWLGDDGGSRKSILEGLYQDPGSPSDKQKKKKNEGEKKKNNNNNQGNYLWGLCKIQFSSNLRNQNCSILI